MKRLVIFCLCLFAVFVFAEETYKIYLNDGRVITSDVKPDVRGDRIYFERLGMFLYVPVNLVDLKKTEKGKTAIQETTTSEPKKQKKVVKYDESKLEEIRQRARLANEDELAALEYTSPEAGGQQAGNQIGQQSAATNPQKRLASLMQQRSILQGNLNSLMEEMSVKRDQFGFATLAADKDRLQKEMTDLENKITEARSKLSSIESQIQITQQEIASTPAVVVEVPAQQQAPPPQQTQTPPPTSEGE